MFRINLLKLRLNLGFTQKQFGETVGVSRGSIQAYEAGRAQPSMETIKLIVDLYGIDDLYLFLYK